MSQEFRKQEYWNTNQNLYGKAKLIPDEYSSKFYF